MVRWERKEEFAVFVFVDACLTNPINKCLIPLLLVLGSMPVKEVGNCEADVYIIKVSGASFRSVCLQALRTTGWTGGQMKKPTIVCTSDVQIGMLDTSSAFIEKS
jgi:hypothetical protein